MVEIRERALRAVREWARQGAPRRGSVATGATAAHALPHLAAFTAPSLRSAQQAAMTSRARSRDPVGSLACALPYRAHVDANGVEDRS